MSRWGENPFWRELVDRLAIQQAATDFTGVATQDDGRHWAHRPGPGEAPPAFLQGRRLVVDVTDRSLVLYPLGLAGRFRISAGFGKRGTPSTLVYRPGRAELLDEDGATTVRVSLTLPVVELERVGEGRPWVSLGAGGTLDAS